MPIRLPSEVIIVYDGTTEIQGDVIPAGTTFTSNMNAMTGQAEVLVRDPNQVYEFVTGKKIVCSIDGVELWGGYITTTRRKFAMPVVDTVTRAPSEVVERQWVLSCVDFNILFDKRVFRDPTNYLAAPENYNSEEFDGDLIEEALGSNKYIDVPAGFDITTQIDNTTNFRSYNTLTNGSITSGSLTVTVDDISLEPGSYPFYVVIKDDPVTGGNREIVKVTGAPTGNTFPIVRAQLSTSAVAHGDNSFFLHYQPQGWPQQGSPWRQLMDDFAQWGAVYYIGPDEAVHYHSIETIEARWGFSDTPNLAAVTASPASYQGATYGFRDIDAREDGSPIVNDALIWGGSEFSGSGQTVFARRQNTDSINEHGRWQLAEIHFGQSGFKDQAGVDYRAKTIVDGDPSAPTGDPKGLKFPQWDLSLKWFAHNVPRISGVPDHLRAGQLVYFTLNVFDGLEIALPLRRLMISFPGKVDAEDEAWVQFSGSFSLQLSDPYTLWRYLLGLKRGQPGSTRVVSTVDGSNPAPYGSIFSGAPTPLPDDTETVFYLPDDRGYIAGTTEVYLSPGILQRRGIDYTESSPDAGEITFTAAPAGSGWIWVICRTT